jgi:hypothetical protein
VSEENKALVRRLVDEAINGGRLELVEDLFALELAEPARQHPRRPCGTTLGGNQGSSGCRRRRRGPALLMGEHGSFGKRHSPSSEGLSHTQDQHH